MRLVSVFYLVLDDDEAGVPGSEVLEVVLDGVLAGAEAGGATGVEGVVDVEGVWSDVLGAVSFFSPFSPAVGTGSSLPGEGFILSE